MIDVKSISSSSSLSIRKRCRVRYCVALLTIFLAPSLVIAEVPSKDSKTLLAVTQQLLDGVTDGNSALWAKYLAPEWFQTDEEGQYVDRSEFLASLRPLPSGQSGKLTMARPRFVGSRNLVVLSYDALEEHNLYGQILRSTFHTTDTWVRRDAGWLLLASQVTALPQPVDGKPVFENDVRAYLGTYALTPDIQLSIAFINDHLVLRRTGRPDEPLFALNNQIFIRHGLRGFWYFDTGSNGSVSELVNWRDNNAIRWRRQP